MNKQNYSSKATIMKKVIFLSIASMLFLVGNVNARITVHPHGKNAKDSLSYTTLSAKILDQVTGEPVVFASVFQSGTNIGTVSNADGEFILKIPGKTNQGTITISHLGYKNKDVSIGSLLAGMHKIELEMHVIPIDEVVVKKLDPRAILLTALSKKKDNYNLDPEMQTGFYRETIKQNRSYVSVSEAILDIYNSGYRDNFDFDRVKIFKGRKSKDVKKMDTVLVKFQGGPRTAMFLDVVKNPGMILDPDMFKYYNYKLTGIIKVNDRNNYVIDFDQASALDYPLYAGKIYVDIETYAITGIDFRLSDKSLENAAKVLIKKKPATMKMDVLSGHYMVNYREIDGKWVLNYVRSEVVFKSKWQKKLFKSTITTMFEMAITDRDTQNIEKFPYKISAKYSDIFAEQVESFEDPNFWGEYNVIKPDESIEVAIKKLSKKLKRTEMND
jgi:hypothetical protein